MRNQQTKEIVYIFAILSVLLPAIGYANYKLSTDGMFGVLYSETIELRAKDAQASTIEQEEAKPGITASVTVSPTPTVNEVKETAPTSEQKESVKALIRKHFGEDADIATAVFTCESGLRPYALNSSPIEHSVGIAQINLADNYGRGKKVHWKKALGKTLEDKQAWLEQPENNVRVAKQIFDASGWYPWSCFTSGAYKNHL